MELATGDQGGGLFGVLPFDRDRAPQGIDHLFRGGVALEASQPRRIGKHEWAHVIYRRENGSLSEYYIWRRADQLWPDRAAGWRHGHDWPTYDHNRSDDGLPSSLLALWESVQEVRRRYGLGWS